MRRTLMLAAAALAVVACSPAGEPSQAPEASAAAPTGAATTPEAFVRSLYGEGEFPGGPSERIEERAIWSARTLALLAESDRLTPEGNVGFFEGHPICDCQDGTPVLHSAIATSTGPASADVAVVQGFAEPGNETHRKTYNLVLEGGQWRIDDQHYEFMGPIPQEPMVQRLTAWIAEARAAPAN
ncbi:MAG: YbjP/YqhG family protein [Pseudomonadota bacterium]|nr:YbjP/YqhG family protein [Pseudomonadota bacterium]